MIKRVQIQRWKKTSGAVLLLAMLFLLLMGMVAGTVMQTSRLEFRMAGNDQFREEAFQRAQGIAAAILEDPGNFPLGNAVGQWICSSTDTREDCDPDQTLDVTPDIALSSAGVLISYEVERQGPLWSDTVPGRTLQQFSSSTVAYDAALFETHVIVDGHSVGLGKAEVVQGVAVVLTSSTQGRWE